MTDKRESEAKSQLGTVASKELIRTSNLSGPQGIREKLDPSIESVDLSPLISI